MSEFMPVIEALVIGLIFGLGYVLGIARGKQIAANRIDEILASSKGWR